MEIQDRKNIIKNLFESGKIKECFGNLFPEREDGIVAFNTFFDPLNREEKYEDHEKCRAFHREMLGGSAYKLHNDDFPWNVVWKDGYAHHKTHISLKYLRAFVFDDRTPFLEDVRKEKEKIESNISVVSNQLALWGLEKDLSSRIAGYLVSTEGIIEKSSVMLGAFKTEVGEAIVSYIYFKTTTGYVGWDDPTYCSQPKLAGSSNKVTDYHHRVTLVFNGDIKVTGLKREEKLFRTTDAGVVSTHFSNKILEAKIIDDQ